MVGPLVGSRLIDGERLGTSLGNVLGGTLGTVLGAKESVGELLGGLEVVGSALAVGNELG